MRAMTTGLAGRLSMILVLAMLLSITLPAYAAEKTFKGSVSISSVTDSAGSININVGKGEGIKEGAKGTVVRDGKQIAEYVVQQVNWGFSRITLMNVAEGYTVRPGDSAPLSGATEQSSISKKKSSKSKTLLTILAVGAAILLLGGHGGGGGDDSSDSSIALTAKKVSTGEDTRNITITAKVNDGNGYAVPDGTAVLFSSTAGVLDHTETTTRAGRATATLSYDSAVDPDTAVVTVRALGRTATIEVSFVTSIELVVNPDTIQVTGSGGTAMQSTVTATCWDALGNLATSGEVKFTASRGTITPDTATINSSGQATATFTSTSTGEIDITATWSKSTQTETVTVTAGPPYDIALTAAPTSVAVEENSRSTITATVKDLKGNPVADGTVVDFSVTADGSGGGNGSFVNPQAVTDNGVAVAYLETKDSSGDLSKSGTATVKAEVLRASQPADVPLPVTDRMKTTTVQFVASAVGEITLSAEPGNIRGWDKTGAESTITAVVYNTDNLPAPDGTTVRFTTSRGFITASSTTTNGIAKATLRSDAARGDGLVDITASAGTGAEEVTVTEAGLVIFSGPPVEANCSVTISPDTIPAVNGSASIDIIANDVNNHPVADGTTVTVTSNKGTVTGTGTTVGGACHYTLTTSSDATNPTASGLGTVTVRIDNVVEIQRTFTVTP